MVRERQRVLLSWSGGKDSALALHELRKQREYEVIGLLTAVTEGDDRVTMHGVSRELIEVQAKALELPLELVRVPKSCSNRVYTDRMGAGLAPYRDSGVHTVAFGDLFLDDIRDFREECLEALGMEAIFPIWHRDTKELSYSFIQLKYKAVVTCVDGSAVSPDLAGRTYDRTFLSDLPLAVDPCGENGEFHTFVYDGPIFNQAVPIEVGGARAEGTLHYCDIITREPAVKKKVRARGGR